MARCGPGAGTPPAPVGDGTTTHRSLPIRVNVPSVSSIAAGGFHSLAVITDGTVRSWGWNPLGQLGDGTTTYRAVPVVVPGLGGVKRLAGGVGPASRS